MFRTTLLNLLLSVTFIYAQFNQREVLLQAPFYAGRIQNVEEERHAASQKTRSQLPPVKYVNSEEYSYTQYPMDKPLLLDCDGSAKATEICHYFCITDISADGGFCNVTNRTCLCQGVSYLVIESAPISAIFSLLVPTLPQLPPKSEPTMTNISVSRIPISQKPIQSNNFNSIGHQQFQQDQKQIPMYNLQYKSPSRYIYNHIRPANELASQKVSNQTRTASTNLNSTLNNNGRIQPTISESGLDAKVENVSSVVENQRNRRSAGSSYANVQSSYSYQHNTEESCSTYTCSVACVSAEYNLPNCIPRCTGGQCECICRPGGGDAVAAIKNFSGFLSGGSGEKVHAANTMKPFRPTNFENSEFPQGSFLSSESIDQPPIKNTMNTFARPPSLY